jgi:hypothetical protein
MYALVVRERGQADQINTSAQHVQANVLPRARQAPGIVSGFWMTDMAGGTLNVMVVRRRRCREIGFGAGTHRTQTALDAGGKCRRI